MLFELCGEVFVVTEIWDEGIREAFYAFLLQRKERLNEVHCQRKITEAGSVIEDNLRSAKEDT